MRPRPSPTGTWAGSRARSDSAGPWRIHLFGHTISEVFWPGVVLPGITFGLLYLWPFIEARVTHDRDSHHLLDRPRDRPVRTAIGTGVLAFYIVLFVAGSQDIIAQKLDRRSRRCCGRSASC